MLKRIAIIENNKVINIIAVDSFVDPSMYGAEELTAPAGIHWTKNADGTFSPPEQSINTIDPALVDDMNALLANT